MRTPCHALVNVAILAGGRPALAAAVLAGAVLPDLPIVCLYALERARGTPEEEIWRSRYQAPVWCGVIHFFHSVPLAVALGLVAWACGAPAVAALFASALLHDALDLPVHGRDAHRHLLPLSQWRFESPLSYWEVERHARAVTVVEWLLAAAATVRLWPGAPWPALVAMACVHAYYARVMVRLVAQPPAEPAR